MAKRDQSMRVFSRQQAIHGAGIALLSEYSTRSEVARGALEVVLPVPLVTLS
jgi:hypothetical protein